MMLGFNSAFHTPHSALGLFFPAVNTAGGAGLAHHDPGKHRQRWLEPAPDPARQILAGGVLQPLDFVQVMMIELLIDRLEDAGQIGEVHDPACLLRHRAGDMNLDAKRMAMQAPAFVALRHVRQVVRRLDSEDLEYFHGKNRKKNGRASLTAFARPAYPRRVTAETAEEPGRIQTVSG